MPFRQTLPWTFPWDQLFIGAVISLMLVLGIWKIATWIGEWLRSPSDDPNRLFSKLARAHRLSSSELQILQEIRRSHPASLPPAALFVDPTVWFESLPHPSSPTRQNANLGLESRKGRSEGWQSDSSLESKQALFLKIFGFEDGRFRY